MIIVTMVHSLILANLLPTLLIDHIVHQQDILCVIFGHFKAFPGDGGMQLRLAWVEPGCGAVCLWDGTVNALFVI